MLRFIAALKYLSTLCPSLSFLPRSHCFFLFLASMCEVQIAMMFSDFSVKCFLFYATNTQTSPSGQFEVEYFDHGHLDMWKATGQITQFPVGGEPLQHVAFYLFLVKPNFYMIWVFLQADIGRSSLYPQSFWWQLQKGNIAVKWGAASLQLLILNV